MAEVVENEIDQESLAAFKDAETKFGECQLSVSMLDVNCTYTCTNHVLLCATELKWLTQL